MKLQTSIIPRADGTVIAHGIDGIDHIFKQDEDGLLTCDVAHEKTIAQLLSTGNFYPTDTNDFDEALKLAESELETQQSSDHPDQTDETDENDGLEVVGNGLPLESNTPPKE